MVRQRASARHPRSRFDLRHRHHRRLGGVEPHHVRPTGDRCRRQSQRRPDRGHPPGRVVFTVYVLTGLCVGISAILLSGRLASASPVVGNLVELDAIAAVVIGGTALTGGKATVTGTFFGVITFGLIFNLLNLLNMPTEIQGIVKGLLILIAVALQRRD